MPGRIGRVGGSGAYKYNHSADSIARDTTTLPGRVWGAKLIHAVVATCRVWACGGLSFLQICFVNAQPLTRNTGKQAYKQYHPQHTASGQHLSQTRIYSLCKQSATPTIWYGTACAQPHLAQPFRTRCTTKLKTKRKNSSIVKTLPLRWTLLYRGQQGEAYLGMGNISLARNIL